MEIPLGNYPGRAGMDVPVTISYSSKAWRVEYVAYQPGTPSSSGVPINDGFTRVVAWFAEHSASGWTSSIGFPVLDNTLVSEFYDGSGNPKSTGGCTGSMDPTSTAAQCYIVDRMLVRMPDGSAHELRSTDQPFQPGGHPEATDLYAVDGTRMRYNRPDRTLYMADGSRYLFATGDYVDRNGNRLHYTGSGWTDTLGRTISSPPLVDGPGAVPGSHPYTPPGTSGQYVFVWKRLGDPGVLTTAQSLKYVADSGCPMANGSFSPRLFQSDIFGRTCIQNAAEVFNPVVLHQIQMPTGRSYTFTYNEYGEINRIELPTGGYERYEYAQTPPLSQPKAPYTQANRGVLHRYVSTGAAADEDAWHYAPASGKVGITAPDDTLTERFMHAEFSGLCAWGYCPETARAGMIYEERSYAPPVNDVRRLLRRKLTQWGVTGSNGSPQFGEAATRNPRVTKEVEILLDTDGDALAKTTEYGYDLSNQFSTGANQTSISEYDYVPVAQSTAKNAAIGSIPRAALPLRTTETAYLDEDPAYRAHNILGQPTRVTIKNGSGAVVSKTTMGYDEAAYQLVNNYGAVTGWSAPVGPRANVTTVRRYLDVNASVDIGSNCPPGVCVDTHAQYDQCGSAVKDIDALDNETLTAYSPIHAYAYPTSVTTPAPNSSSVPNPSGGPAFGPGTFGSTTGLTSFTAYDPSTGRVTARTDANQKTTTFDYTDPLGRLKQVDSPDGGRTIYTYLDTHQCGAGVETRTLLDDAGREMTSWQFTDGLGRPYISQTYDGQDPDKPYRRSDKVYDSVGRVSQVSYPYRSPHCGAVDPSRKWTTTDYDALGRVTRVTTPDGARVLTAYSGDMTWVGDQDDKRRVSRSDALGRLTDVWEVKADDTSNPDPGLVSVPFTTPEDLPVVSTGYRTVYTYDAAGNLRKVDQGGQARFFLYDALSRLIRARHPEQGTHSQLDHADPFTNNGQWSLAYGYDAAGNRTTRRDARNVETTYFYDHLNRNLITHYAGGTATPDVLRFYDNAANGKGRLRRTEASGVAASEVISYDFMGRPTQQRQSFWVNNAWGQEYPVTRAYNKAGGVTSQTYPSGHAVAYNYDTAGRLADNGSQLAFTGNLGDGVPRTYASEIRYHALGGMEQERFGTQTPVYNKSLFNVRGQLAEIRLSTYGITSPGRGTDWNRGAIISHYSTSGWGASGGGPDNNGNLQAQDIFIPKGDNPDVDGWDLSTFHYDYDALNRLKWVKESRGGADQWKQAYDYDRWGNRTINAAETQVYAPSSGYSIPEPQFDVVAGTNRLGVPAGQLGRMDYDAAGNLINDTHSPLSYGSPTGTQTRFYDGEGRMASAQINSTQTALYAYDGDGQRVKRNNGSGEVWQVYGMGRELLAEYAKEGSLTQPQREYGYRGSELLVTVEASTRRNVALASAGATATAQSHTPDGVYPGLHFQPSYVNDGRRYVGPQGDWYWRDGAGLPTWVQVDFAGAKTIDEVDVYTLADYPAYMTQSDPTAAQTFTQYGATSFEVQYWTGAAWAAVPGGSVTGNNLVWRKVTFPALTTSKIRVRVNAAADGVARITEVEAWEASRANFALASRGGQATASSTTPDTEFPGLTFPVSGVNDGDRKGVNWEHGGGWRDGTNNSYPDWAQVEFAGEKSIDEIDVFTLQDATSNPSEPTEAMTFTQYGVTAYEVQYWSGTGWLTVPGGSVTGNNKVWRKFTFPAVTTSKVRVLIHNALAGRSRLVEVEAWGAGAASTGADVRWLVSDHLGTPRMVVDKTGSLSGVSRHDYLPFGEELFSGMGGRTSTQGYGATDKVRQQLTKKERDVETGLDYFGARYYSAGSGRFTSTDKINISRSRIVNPQRWNLFVFVVNNPVNLYDPDGLQDRGTGGGKTIDVFLAYKGSEKHKKQVEARIGSPGGAKVKVHGFGESTGKNIIESLKRAGGATIIVSHSDRGDPVTNKKGEAIDKWSGEAALVYDGRFGANKSGFGFDTGAQGEYKGFGKINAELVGVYSCALADRTESGFQNSLASPDAAFITSDGGEDGLTQLNMDVEFAIVSAIMFGEGADAHDIAVKLQSMIDRSFNAYHPNRTDKVEVFRSKALRVFDIPQRRRRLGPRNY